MKSEEEIRNAVRVAQAKRLVSKMGRDHSGEIAWESAQVILRWALDIKSEDTDRIETYVKGQLDYWAEHAPKQDFEQMMDKLNKGLEA